MEVWKGDGGTRFEVNFHPSDCIQLKSVTSPSLRRWYYSDTAKINAQDFIYQKTKRLRSSADKESFCRRRRSPSPAGKNPSTFAATIDTVAAFPPLSAMRPESGPPLPSPPPSAALPPLTPLQAELPARRPPPQSSSRLVSSSAPAMVPAVSPAPPEAPSSSRTRRRVAVDGRDARVGVPVPVARMFHLTRELGLRSHVEALLGF